MPAGWQMQENTPTTAREPMISAGVEESDVITAPAAVPKKEMMRAVRLLTRSAKIPQGRAKSPNMRYIGNPSARTSLRSIRRESVSEIASTGKAIS